VENNLYKMTKRYLSSSATLFFIIILAVTSCKKSSNAIVTNNTTTNNPTTGTPVKLGIYEEADSTIYKALFMVISKMGTVTLPDTINGLIFDTGSGGLVIDAHGIIPSSMITSSGFNFTGDSTVIDGITITNQTSTISYGADAATNSNVYGNLAYADVQIGEPTDATITVKRLPFFLYYKSTNSKGAALPEHEFDVLGVNSEYDFTFSNGVPLASPFAAYDPGSGLTRGFKMNALGANNFTSANSIPLTPGVITVGLTADDIGSSSPYTFTKLGLQAPYGYPPQLAATINYGSNTITGAGVIFDSGTDPYNYIEDNNASATITKLPVNTSVSVTTTTAKFNYPFTTSASDYLTYIENPSVSGESISILSLEYFLNNGYLIDYTDHKLGLKNN
jgi:hypothetical protein